MASIATDNTSWAPVGPAGYAGAGASPATGTMDMHQPAPLKTSAKPDTSPQKKDAVARYVHKLLWEAEAERKKYDSDWNHYYNIYMGDQWPVRKMQRGVDWQARLVVNYTFTIIESIIATMTDNKPKINVVPTSWEQQAYGQNLQEAIDSVWYRRKAMSKLQDALKNAMIYGIGYLKTWWDPNMENGLGDIEIGVPDVFSIFVDPRATSFHDAEYIVEVRPVTLDYIQRNYPEKGALVRPDSDYYGSVKWKRDQGKGPSPTSSLSSLHIMSPVDDGPLKIDQTEFSSPPFTSASASRAQEVNLIECWVKDYSMKTVEVPVTTVDPTTGMPMMTMTTVEVAAYPHGRLIHVANGITLQDTPSPYNRWPYIRLIDNTRPGEFFGFGEPKVLKDLQFELNKRRSQMVDHAALMGNSIWVVDRDSGVSRDEISNKPGLILTKYRGAEVRREPAAPMPGWQFQMVETTIRDMREISGISAVAGGVVPRGIRSGSGFDAAQEIATLRIRLKVKNLESALEDMGRNLVSLIQQFYTTPRMIRIIGSAGKVAFVPFDGKSVRGDWDIRIGIGSTLPVSKSVQSQLILQLAGMGLVDQRAVLEYCEIRDAEEIMTRMGAPALPEPAQGYPGWPGQPALNRPSPSSYALSIRSAPVPMGPPAPPGGMPPQMGSPVGGGPAPSGGPPP